MTTNQPRIPHDLKIGDRVLFQHGTDAELSGYGDIVDILSTQFLINDVNNVTYIVPFKYVLPVLRSAIP